MFFSNKPFTHFRKRGQHEVELRYTPAKQSTWIPKAKLPQLVEAMIKDGKASYQELQQLALKALAVMVPLRAHPQTKSNTMSVFFTKNNSPAEPVPWSLVKESAGAATECQPSCKDAVPRKKSRKKKKQYQVPAKTEFFIDELLQQINESKRGLSVQNPDLETMNASYRELCKSKHFGKTAQDMYPISRHRHYWKVTHPKNCFQICEDRKLWKCTSCVPTIEHDMREKEDGSVRNAWHWGNCKKHFLSEQHWSNMVSKTNTTSTLKDSCDHHSAESVAKQELVQAIVDDAVIEMCTKSLPHTATSASLDCTARALLSVAGTDGPVTTREIFKARKNVSEKVANILIRLNAVTARETRRRKDVCVVRRGRCAISKRIFKLSGKALQSKVKFLLTCQRLGLAADESDTFSGSAPLAGALQGCNANFEWINAFIGQVPGTLFCLFGFLFF